MKNASGRLRMVLAARPAHPRAADHVFVRSQPNDDERYSVASLSRSALLITDTELRLIAAAASIGLRSQPVTG